MNVFFTNLAIVTDLCRNYTSTKKDETAFLPFYSKTEVVINYDDLLAIEADTIFC